MTHFKTVLLLLTAFLATACGDNEAPPAEDHEPRSYRILVNDVLVNEPYTFTSGQTVRVRLQFFNAAEEDLDEVEDSHFGGLSFEPGSRATVVRVADHNYQFDVTGASAGTATLQVSYGHDAAADEQTFPEAAVTVNPDEDPALSQ
ncbi:MAG TPA: hypothetical protein VE399_04375 [Gemmatimonadales bacterium]|jgi:hypothetical protein|nr:hypothetical protein [Gemmatimonadales bacterium]